MKPMLSASLAMALALSGGLTCASGEAAQPTNLGTVSAGAKAGIGYPGPGPGTAHGRKDRDFAALDNAILRARWRLNAEGIRSIEFHDLQSGQSLEFAGDILAILSSDGRRYGVSQMQTEGDLRLIPLTADPDAARQAARNPGWMLRLPLRSSDGRLRVTWRAILRDDANAIRQEIEISAVEQSCVIREVVWMDGMECDGRTVGRVEGSPVVAGPFFLGAENPHARNEAFSRPATEGPGRLSCRVPCETLLQPGGSLTQSFVVGVTPPGQLRRGFACYLEQERAHPYRPFLHYNSWYDIAWSPFALNETNCLEAIRILGERFIRPENVPLQAVVFDDGWDDPHSLWKFHAGFPDGFTPLAEACRAHGTHLGVWLSPFGGYGEPKRQRLEFGQALGYETNATGFSLAGPRYYAAFKDACVHMIRTYGVNHFKFDGIAAGMYANGSADYLPDTEAMRRLMIELRQESPGLYINLTTGSWPSPFWLRYADSVWRQGGDMGLAGKGSRQQQWLTYRDRETYRNIVLKGPLFPLNSLMTQGVAYSRHGSAGDPTFNSAGFKDDIRAFFASGTGLQELYIQPDKLTSEDWRVLAEAARWSHEHADVLVDTHWIGGDPGQLEVYGWAAWSGQRGTVAVRNPDDTGRSFELEIGSALELTPGSPRLFQLKSPWQEDAGRAALTAEVGKLLFLQLQPFEIRVLVATPVPGDPHE